MQKSFLYRWFRLGACPPKVMKVLENETITFFDEGLSGSVLYKNVKGPRFRCNYRVKWFMGFLAITNERILGYTFGRKVINVPINDEKLLNLNVTVPEQNRLHISFDASVFREDWRGEISYRYKTELAQDFADKFKAIKEQLAIDNGKLTVDNVFYLGKK